MLDNCLSFILDINMRSNNQHNYNYHTCGS